jgi:hypothetical protein
MTATTKRAAKGHKAQTPSPTALPPHPNADAHARVMAWVEKAAPEEVFQHAVKVGIYYPDGSLRPEYGGPRKRVARVRGPAAAAE